MPCTHFKACRGCVCSCRHFCSALPSSHGSDVGSHWPHSASWLAQGAPSAGLCRVHRRRQQASQGNCAIRTALEVCAGDCCTTRHKRPASNTFPMGSWHRAWLSHSNCSRKRRAGVPAAPVWPSTFVPTMAATYAWHAQPKRPMAAYTCTPAMGQT
jgi:hypothetical protein